MTTTLVYVAITTILNHSICEQLKANPDRTFHPTDKQRKDATTSLVKLIMTASRGHANPNTVKHAVQTCMSETFEGVFYGVGMKPQIGEGFVLRVLKAFDLEELPNVFYEEPAEPNLKFLSREKDIQKVCEAVLKLEPVDTGDCGSGAACPFCCKEQSWGNETANEGPHELDCPILIARDLNTRPQK